MRKNPWTQKNPFMSMWLSGAHQMMGAARGRLTAAARRESSNLQAEFTRQMIDFWTGQGITPVKRRNRK